MNPRTTPSTATLSAADFFKCCVLLFCCFRFCSFLEPGPIWVNNCLTEHLRNKHENIHMCLGSVVSSLSWDPSSRHWRLDGRSFGENNFFGSFDAVVFSDAMTARRGSPGHCLLTGLEQSGKSLPPLILKPPPPCTVVVCLLVHLHHQLLTQFSCWPNNCLFSIFRGDEGTWHNISRAGYSKSAAHLLFDDCSSCRCRGNGIRSCSCHGVRSVPVHFSRKQKAKLLEPNRMPVLCGHIHL